MEFYGLCDVSLCCFAHIYNIYMQVGSERIARLHSRVSGVQCGALTEIAADVRLRDKELQKIIHEMDAQHASEIEAKQRGHLALMLT